MKLNFKSKITPRSFRDYLSILSFISFLAIFLNFSFGNTWLESNMTGIFLLLSGLSFLLIGKAVSIKKWARDGIQQNELSQIISIIVGFSSFIIGLLFLLNIMLPERFLGYVGILALIPAGYILLDYFKKIKK
jgi:hypothetical protein